MKQSFVIGFLLLLVSATGCEFKKEDVAYPQPLTCDTLNVKYSLQVKEVLAVSCLQCHSNAVGISLGGGVILDNYAGVSFWALNGVLLDDITHAPGANPMPKNAPKLSNCNIAKIRKWVENGAPNN